MTLVSAAPHHVTAWAHDCFSNAVFTAIILHVASFKEKIKFKERRFGSNAKADDRVGFVRRSRTFHHSG
jgi:hypothetical protein